MDLGIFYGKNTYFFKKKKIINNPSLREHPDFWLNFHQPEGESCLIVTCRTYII